MELTTTQIKKYFESSLGPLKSIGKGNYRARCPFHDDSDPSFSVNPDKGAYHCFGCDAKGGFIDFEMRKNGGTRAEAWQNIQKIVGLSSTNGSRPHDKVYDYTDEAGNVLYRVVRKPGKKFSQCRPDGKGRWIYDLNGVRRVPYRLREVLTASRVFITEGEKDVETLRAQGLTATTNGSAVTKWPEKFGVYFKGREVVILPDNDQPGRAKAEQVAASLHSVAAWVKVVALPGLDEKGDITDWLAKGGENTKEKLLPLIDECPRWQPTPKAGGAQPHKGGSARDGKGPVELRAAFELPDGRLAEIVSAPNGTGTRFCLFRPGSQACAFAEQLEQAGKIIKPAASEWVKMTALLLPGEPDFSETHVRQLCADVRTYLGRWFEGEERLLWISALYVLLTWRIHIISEVPYLRVLGEPGTGKSRWLSAMAQVCHRAVQPFVDISESSLFRLLKAVPDATLANDEADRRTTLDDPVTQVLRAGMERGRHIWRSDPIAVGQAHEPQAFPAFGPKLLAAARPFKDDALESRILSFSVPLREVSEHIPLNVQTKLPAEGTALRNRLLAHRIESHAQREQFSSRMAEAANKLRGEHLEGRAIQIGSALFALAEETGLPPAIEACREVLRQHSHGITQGRRESLDGVIFEALESMRGEGKIEVPLSDLYQLICEMCARRGMGRTNSDGSPHPPFNTQGLSRRLRKEARRFGVGIEDRVHGSDQPRIRLGSS